MDVARCIIHLFFLISLFSARAQSSEDTGSESLNGGAEVRDDLACSDLVSTVDGACVWTSAQFECEEECTNKCLLANNHHLRYIAALFGIKAFEAIQCSVMAGLVNVATLEMDAIDAAESMDRVPGVNSARNLMVDSERKQGRECPTADDIDRIKPALERAALVNVERNSENPSYEDDKPNLWIEDILHSFYRDPERLKSLFSDRCETKVLAFEHEPLKSLYLSLQHPDDYPSALANMSQDDFTYYSMVWHADTAPRSEDWPLIVTVCRPKGGIDDHIVNAGRAMAAACQNAVQQTENGACLTEFHAQLLAEECFDVIAAVLDADYGQALKLFEDLSSIHEACTSATTEERCSAVEPFSELTALADTLVGLKKKAQESMEKQRTSMACCTCIFNTVGMVTFMAVLMMQV